MKSVLCILVIAVLSGCLQASYQQQAPQNEIPSVQETGFDYFSYSIPDAEISHPLIVEFPVVRSPMPYYIMAEPGINPGKYNTTIQNLRAALELWENATIGKVKFVEVFEVPEEGIIINITAKNYYTYDIPPGTSREEIAGEARPLYYDLDNYSLIVGGEVTIGPLYGTSENRVQIVHELGHVMGFGHSSNTHSVMYPIVAYSQEITPDMIEALDVLYSGVPEASQSSMP